MSSNPTSPVSLASEGSTPHWMKSPTELSEGSPTESRKGTPKSSKGSPKSSRSNKKGLKAFKVAEEPEKNLSNDVIQAEATIQGANDMLNKRGTGLVVLIQKGRHFYLDFLNVKIRNPNKRVIRVYLSKKRARGTKDQLYLEKRSTSLHLDLGEDGNFVGDGVVGVSHFRQHLGTALEGVGGVNPLDWKGITFAKPACEIPRTPSADIFAFANMGKPEDFDLDEEEAKGEAAALEERRMLELMMGQARGSLTLKDVKRKADAVFRHLGLDNKNDELDYPNFCKGMKYLGTYLTESRSRKLFKIADLSSNGEIDAGEFEMAVHINDKIPVTDKMSPKDAFEIFDEKMRGGVDAIEFHKLMMALGVQITAAESMEEFNNADGDNSGILDYDEFRSIWIRICDVVSELHRRNKAATSEEKVKKAKIRDRMDRELLVKLVDREEAEENQLFAKAKEDVIAIRRAARMAKSERASRRRADRTREANIARREKAKLEREKKSRASIRNREMKRRQRVEAELLDELAKQTVARKKRELEEMHIDRARRAMKEQEEREARGEHEICLSQKDLRVVPTFLYKSRQAHIRLNTLQLLDISNNKLLALPESGCFFHCASLKKIDLSNNRLQQIPDEISECTELIIVNMQNNDITELPEKFVTKCVNLRKLNIAENEMIRLPGDFGALKSLETLIGFHNQLEALPESFGNLTNLHTLDLSVNKLVSLPYRLGECTNLTLLDFSWNRVEVIPNSVGTGLNKLITLNASNNIIHFLPSDMSGLTSVESFDMTYNELISLPESLSMMTNLKTLNICNNRINQLPVNFGDMRLLETALLRNNVIETIPPTIGYLRRLHFLDFGMNKVTELPPEMGAMLGLKYIDGSFNRIKGTWPEELGCLPILTNCNFSHNLIDQLPHNIGGLTTLTALNFSHNKLKTVPDSIGNMLSLTNLNISSNQLVSFPERIGDAQALQHLDLSANRLSAAPRTIGWLRCLRTLSLYNNKLCALPAEYGTLIQRLEKFDCGRNNFKDLTQKWSTDWKRKDKFTTIFSEGYTETEASNWALEAQSWYPDAYEVWQRMFSHKWASADLSEYLRVVRLKMGDDWRSRYEPKVRALYFKSKHNLGFAPRYDQLIPSEQQEKAEALAKAKEWHNNKIPELRKEARAIRVRAQASYLFDEREIVRRMKFYGDAKKKMEEEKHDEEMRQLKDLTKVLYQRQDQRMKKRENERLEAKLREQRLLKTAARSRALRASRKAHLSPENDADDRVDDDSGNNYLLNLARNVETR